MNSGHFDILLSNMIVISFKLCVFLPIYIYEKYVKMCR